MPSLNRETRLDKDGTVYVVKATEQDDDRYTDGSYTRDTHYCSSLSAALVAGLHEHDCDPEIHRMGTGLILLVEPHEDGEPYSQVTIADRRVYCE